MSVAQLELAPVPDPRPYTPPQRRKYIHLKPPRGGDKRRDQAHCGEENPGRYTTHRAHVTCPKCKETTAPDAANPDTTDVLTHVNSHSVTELRKMVNTVTSYAKSNGHHKWTERNECLHIEVNGRAVSLAAMNGTEAISITSPHTSAGPDAAWSLDAANLKTLKAVLKGGKGSDQVELIGPAGSPKERDTHEIGINRKANGKIITAETAELWPEGAHDLAEITPTAPYSLDISLRQNELATLAAIVGAKGTVYLLVTEGQQVSAVALDEDNQIITERPLVANVRSAAGTDLMLRSTIAKKLAATWKPARRKDAAPFIRIQRNDEHSTIVVTGEHAHSARMQTTMIVAPLTEKEAGSARRRMTRTFLGFLPAITPPSIDVAEWKRLNLLHHTSSGQRRHAARVYGNALRAAGMMDYMTATLELPKPAKQIPVKHPAIGPRSGCRYCQSASQRSYYHRDRWRENQKDTPRVHLCTRHELAAERHHATLDDRLDLARHRHNDQQEEIWENIERIALEYGLTPRWPTGNLDEEDE